MKKILMIMLLGMSTNVAFGMDDQAAPAVAVAKQKATEEQLAEIKVMRDALSELRKEESNLQAILNACSEVEGSKKEKTRQFIKTKQEEISAKKEELAKYYIENNLERESALGLPQLALLGAAVSTLFFPQMKCLLKEFKRFFALDKTKKLNSNQQFVYGMHTLNQLNQGGFGYKALSKEQKKTLLANHKAELNGLRGLVFTQKLDELADQDFNPRNRLDHLEGNLVDTGLDALGIDAQELGFNFTQENPFGDFGTDLQDYMSRNGY